MSLINVNSETLKINESGSVTGNIFFESSGFNFPEMLWFDFPVRLIGWWIDQFLCALKENSSEFEFWFMEGAFKVSFKAAGIHQYVVKFIDRGKIEKILFEDKVCIEEIKTALIDCGQAILVKLEEKDISCDDKNILESKLRELSNQSL